MKYRLFRRIFIVSAFCCISALVFTGIGFSQQNPNKISEKGRIPLFNPFRQTTTGITNPFLKKLFDPRKWKMTQSYTISYMSGRYGGTQGIYQNNIYYKPLENLNIRFSVRYLHTPMGFRNSSYSINSGFMLPGFALTYKFSNNTYLHISFDSFYYPNSYLPYSDRMLYSPFYWDNSPMYDR